MVRQVVRHAFWPSGDGRALVMLRMEPDELAQRYGLRFEEGNDDLDAFRLAAIALPDGSQAWLMRHRGDPVAGTVVYVDTRADLCRAKTQLAQALNLADADIAWESPLIADPEPHGSTMPESSAGS